MRVYWMATLLLASVPAHAEIYMCEENGRKIFSQQPCGNDAKTMTVQAAGGSITLPEEFDEQAALDVCKMMVKSWEVAAQMRRQRIPMDTAEQRTFGFLRERITNFDEATRRAPELFSTMRAIAQRLTNDAYRSPDIQPGEREIAIQQCARNTMLSLNRAKATLNRKQKTMM